MSQYTQNYPSIPVADLGVEQRSTFIVRTYAHLAGAIALFTAIEVFIFTQGYDVPIAKALTSVSWLLVLGGFMVVSWLASRVAASAQSKPAQYGALFGYVLAQAILFVPLLYVANRMVGGGVISSAAGVTLAGFGLLTGIVFVTRKDFSFLRIFLVWTAILALVAIAAAAIFGLKLGFWFSVGMVLFAGAAILHDTSNVLRYYPQDRYVSAALQLFASVALLFWYVLSIFISRR
jgi:FtsH-binding integral membrane protein